MSFRSLLGFGRKKIHKINYLPILSSETGNVNNCTEKLPNEVHSSSANQHGIPRIHSKSSTNCIELLSTEMKETAPQRALGPCTAVDHSHPNLRRDTSEWWRATSKLSTRSRREDCKEWTPSSICPFREWTECQMESKACGEGGDVARWTVKCRNRRNPANNKSQASFTELVL